MNTYADPIWLDIAFAKSDNISQTVPISILDRVLAEERIEIIPEEHVEEKKRQALQNTRAELKSRGVPPMGRYISAYRIACSACWILCMVSCLMFFYAMIMVAVALTLVQISPTIAWPYAVLDWVAEPIIYGSALGASLVMWTLNHLDRFEVPYWHVSRRKIFYAPNAPDIVRQNAETLLRRLGPKAEIEIHELRHTKDPFLAICFDKERRFIARWDGPPSTWGNDRSAVTAGLGIFQNWK